MPKSRKQSSRQIHARTIFIHDAGEGVRVFAGDLAEGALSENVASRGLDIGIDASLSADQVCESLLRIIADIRLYGLPRYHSTVTDQFIGKLQKAHVDIARLNLVAAKLQASSTLPEKAKTWAWQQESELRVEIDRHEKGSNVIPLKR